MRKRFVPILFLLCVLQALCGCNKVSTDLERIPLLTYAEAVGSLQYSEWNIEKNEIVKSGEDCLAINDLSTSLYEIGWNGDDFLVLPEMQSSVELENASQDIRIEFKQDRKDVLTKQWRVWNLGEQHLSIVGMDKVYQIDISNLHEAYECAGIVDKNDEIALLFVNHVLGEATLYCLNQETGSGQIHAIDGFEGLVNSQIETEKTAIEHGYGFFFTDGYKVYYIDAESKQAQKVFSKNDFAKSYHEKNPDIENILYSCRISAIGAYKNGLLVELLNDETNKFLYRQTEDEYIVLDCTEIEESFVLPNLE